MREMWGNELNSLDDIREVFVRFCRGEIGAIPWYDAELASESEIILTPLLRLNQAGLLTINSQPRINGAPSNDPRVGWGGKGGYIYQKAYIEFFFPGDSLALLLDLLEKHASLTYHAIDHQGVSFANCDSVNAVTWGVFPGREIIQPTVVDPISFEVWKDEAFSLWLDPWAQLYRDHSPASEALLQEVHDTFFLVNVVDNDFIAGDIWGVFLSIIDDLL